MYDLVSLTEAALITAIDKLANNADKLTVDEIRLLHEMYIAGTIEKLQQKFEAAEKDAQEFLAKEEANEVTVSEIVTAKEEVKEEKPKAKRGRPKAKAKEEALRKAEEEAAKKAAEDKAKEEAKAAVAPAKEEEIVENAEEKVSEAKKATKEKK
nr:MAG TPA: hypothetical protein [Caudoviricetes sp.]